MGCRGSIAVLEMIAELNSPEGFLLADQDFDEDVIEDPYKPLLYNEPGPFAEKPFKLKIPQKRAAPKVPSRLAMMPRLSNRLWLLGCSHMHLIEIFLDFPPR